MLHSLLLLQVFEWSEAQEPEGEEGKDAAKTSPAAGGEGQAASSEAKKTK